MADFSEINQEINEQITTNGQGAITGEKLNTVLRDMVSAVNDKKQDPIQDLSEIRSGAALGATALQSEQDPTVPSWAKQANKPSYDYSEIGNTPDLSGFITKNVNDLTNYYLKSETYSQTEVNALIGAIRQFHYEIYATLPQTGQGNVLYLIGPTGSGTDKYEEYVYANNAFVKIGDTSIDLSGYVTTSALNTALADYTTTANLTTLLAGKQDTISDLTTIRSGAELGATAYQKPSTGIPASDLASGVIPAPEVFVATVGLTTYQEIAGALAEGKVVIAVDGNNTYYYVGVVNYAYYFFTFLSDTYTFVSLNNMSFWNFSVPYVVENILNKVPSISSSSTDTEYPSAKCVYDTLLDYVQKSQTVGLLKNDGTVDTTQYGTYSKPSGGIPASDLASGVIPTVPTNVSAFTNDAGYLTQHQDVSGKQDKPTTTTISASTLTQEITDNVIYNAGELSALTITLPNTINEDFICQLNFTSGTTATTLTAPNTIKWAGDDLTSNVFAPVASKRYTVMFYSDGVNVRGVVQGFVTT